MTDIEDLSRRVQEQERIHQRGGPCEQQATRCWQSIDELSVRLSKLETKMYLVGAAIGVCGPLLAKWVGNHIGI
jgi:hypothetical protein